MTARLVSDDEQRELRIILRTFASVKRKLETDTAGRSGALRDLAVVQNLVDKWTHELTTTLLRAPEPIVRVREERS